MGLASMVTNRSQLWFGNEQSPKPVLMDSSEAATLLWRLTGFNTIAVARPSWLDVEPKNGP